MQRYHRNILLLLAVLIVAGVVAAMLVDVSKTPPAVQREPELFSFVQALPVPSGHHAPNSSRYAEQQASDVLSGSALSAAPAMTESSPVATVSDSRGRHEWRSVFERVLMMRNERPVSELRRQVFDELTQRFGVGEATDGLASFDRFLRYRETVEPLQLRTDAARDIDELREAFAAIKALRSQMFSADETAQLFPHDDAYEQAMLVRMEALGTSTNDEERHTRLQAWEASVPPEIRIVEELRSGVVRLPPSFAVPSEEAPSPEAR